MLHNLIRAMVSGHWKLHKTTEVMMTSSNKTISALLAICAGNSPVNGEFPAQKPVTLMFLWCALWINNWVNNREAGDLRHHRTHYYVIVMIHHRDDKNHIQKSYPKISIFIITLTDIYHKIHCWNWLWGPKTVLICTGASRSEVMSGNLFDTSTPL